MKKILFFNLIILSICAYAVVHEHPSFIVDYDKIAPAYVAYTLKASDLADKKRVNIAFNKCPFNNTLDPKLYSGLGDKGHCCAADDREANGNADTYYTCNVMLQCPILNRGSYKALEYRLRVRAKQGENLYIVCGPRFKHGNETIVPDSCFKCLLKDGKVTEAWIFPNNERSRGPPDKFKVAPEVFVKEIKLDYKSIYKALRKKEINLSISPV